MFKRPSVHYGRTPEPGGWNIPGWTLIFGGLFIAAWSTYAFETAVWGGTLLKVSCLFIVGLPPASSQR